MSPALHAWLPDRPAITDSLTRAIFVGGTLYVVERSLSYAVTAGLAFLALQLVADTAENVVGDYADNVVLGTLILGATGYVAVLGSALGILVGGVVAGGWFLADGVQHLRHGVTRDEVGVPYTHEGSVLTGLPKALLARLAEPLLLETRDRQ
ncbi:hypothetical protein [Halomicrobium katesii]|uniref:hypothetical protein n=1 Tax=Halomicrobium katesii TaxID=437163 RepID=UPI000372EF73|nr:hypothetical protein [Halomicrobium katesii]